MLSWVAIAVGGVVGGVVSAAAMKPDTFRMQRTKRIEAPPDRILPQITDFRNWAHWSPWENIDPDLKRTMSGAPSGPGAVYEWSGNSKAGQGRMEITDVTPRKVSIKLDFIKPFEAHNVAEFHLEPTEGATDVTWLMHGKQKFAHKVMGVFISMDRLVGKDFEKGLASMKGVVEGRN
jgi:hypothetical protein